MASSPQAAMLLSVIHHEKQESGSMLCAQHALNALLQGSYYDPSQLADIAAQLDELERAELDEEAWAARGKDEGSLNVDATGFFSVGVLEQALHVWGLTLTRWRSEAMRPYHDKPEEQLGFVLNFRAHWFCIRSFTGGYWFNLNSFLPEPAWVGPSYLGALLEAAETEGYSVFCVRQQEGNRGNVLATNSADELAASMAPASQAGSGPSIDAASLGLRPSVTGGSSSNSNSNNRSKIRRTGAEDEDADLHAALRASLADARLSSAEAEAAVPAPATPAGSSALAAPAAPRGTRRARSGNSASDDEMSETDAHVDALAPSRQRQRANHRPPGAASSSSSFGPAATATRGLATGSRAPLFLPSASGGRRRASRVAADIEEDEAVLARSAGGASATAGASREDAIPLDDDSSSASESAQAGPSGTNVIAIDDDDDEEEEDDERDESVLAARGQPRSPFLNPVMGASIDSDVEDDFLSASSGDEVQEVDAWSPNARAGAGGAAGPAQDRMYDDEDADLQRALAASMRDVEGGGDDEDWPEFAGFNAPAAPQQQRGRERSRTPDDVGRIARMREEAKRKEREEKEEAERIARGEPPRKSEVVEEKKAGADEDSDDEEEEEAEVLSPEEIRRRRLARFGA